MAEDVIVSESDGQKKSVLVVEDDKDIRELYVMVLGQAGYDVVACPDGVAAMAEANKRAFDVVLLDLMMPNMSGLEFLRELKKHPPKGALGPIVVMSNLAYQDAKDEAIELGAVDFLVKAEMEPKQIVGKVEELLS